MHLRAFGPTAVLVAACSQPSTSAPIPSARPAAIPAGTPLRYDFVTDWRGAERGVDGVVIANDRGYVVGIEALAVGVGAVELVPCAPETTASDRGAALARTLWQSLGPATARADHAWGSDSSASEVDRANSLMSPDAVEAGPSPASGAAYCELFWTATTVEEAAADGTALRRASIYFRGWYTAPGSDVRTRLEHEVALGQGAVVSLEGAWSSGAVARITRHPARSFDGIAMSELSESEVLFALVQNLTRTSTAAWIVDR